MPAKSQAQQKAAGAALSAKRGETKKSELKGASKSMYESMSETQLEEFAETDRKGLPNKVKPKR
jgi:putative salt-induced outer membrane protein YdiY